MSLHYIARGCFKRVFASLLAHVAHGLLTFALCFGAVTAIYAEMEPARPGLDASCGLTDCAQEIQECESLCISPSWRRFAALLSPASPGNGNPVAGIAAVKPSYTSGILNETSSPKATAGQAQISYMKVAAEGAEPSGSETIKPSAETPQPHWSHLPIWGAEAAARGYRIPLPFGIGATFYDAKQPVTVKDLKLGVGNGPPESTTFVKVGDPIVSWQQNVSSRFDVWPLPFLNLYGVAGYTRGNTRGRVTVTGPVFGLLNQEIPLLAEFHGPTVGGGVTVALGMKITEWRDLTAFMVGDVNHTVTFLSFKGETLIAETKPHATVAAPRFGLRGSVTESISASMWVGAMYQRIQEEIAGSVSGRSLEFIINQRAASPWNTLVGGRLELGSHFGALVEGGFGGRSSVLAAMEVRF